MKVCLREEEIETINELAKKIPLSSDAVREIIKSIVSCKVADIVSSDIIEIDEEIIDENEKGDVTVLYKVYIRDDFIAEFEALFTRFVEGIFLSYIEQTFPLYC